MDKLLPMALAVPLYLQVASWMHLGVLIVLVVIEVVAFINCLTQRADAFPVVGSLTKPAWLAILGGAVLFSVLCGLRLPILAFAGVTAAAIYLLDVRPALRDATDGSGSW